MVVRDDIIRQLAGREKLTQLALAKLSGVNRVTVGQLWNGEDRNYKSETLEKLAQALGTTVHELTAPRQEQLVA